MDRLYTSQQHKSTMVLRLELGTVRWSDRAGVAYKERSRFKPLFTVLPESRGVNINAPRLTREVHEPACVWIVVTVAENWVEETP